MPDANEWLFEIIWDISDKAHEADMPELASKLEEAMDTYLAESQAIKSGSVQFQSHRLTDANDRVMEMARDKKRTKWALNKLLSDAKAREQQRHMATRAAQSTGVVSSSRHDGVRFAWPL